MTNFIDVMLTLLIICLSGSLVVGLILSINKSWPIVGFFGIVAGIAIIKTWHENKGE